MYRPRSLHSDIGDVEIIEFQGKLHMFHLVIPNRDLVAHAVSEDGLSWKSLPPAVRTGDPGAWDDDMIRTVSVTPKDGRFFMLYCATCRKDGGRVERMCGAVSDDLMKWEKLAEINGVTTEGEIYEDAGISPERVSFRDPKPFLCDGLYYLTVCARAAKGPMLRRGVTALLVSEDLIHWSYREPLFAPNAYMELECPQIYEINGKYYLIASIMEDASQRYWVADHIEGPYGICEGGNLLMPIRTHYAGRIARFQGRDVFACWTFAKEDGPSPFGLRVSPGAVIKYVPAVLDVCVDEKGRLVLRSPEAWNTYRDCGPQPMLGNGPKPVYNTAGIQYTQNSLQSNFGVEVLSSGASRNNFTLDCHLKMEGYRVGVVFCADAEGSGYFAEFYPGEDRLRLVKHFLVTTPQGHCWFDYAVLAETHVDLSKASEGLNVQVRKVNGEMEISVGGRLCISTVSTFGAEGFVGLFADCGSISASHDEITNMRIPGNS